MCECVGEQCDATKSLARSEVCVSVVAIKFPSMPRWQSAYTANAPALLTGKFITVDSKVGF